MKIVNLLAFLTFKRSRLLVPAVVLALIWPSEMAFAKKEEPHGSMIKGEVRSCNDGDTCRIFAKGKSLRIRLTGIDAPEIKQPSGKEAKRHLTDLIVGEEVELDCEGKSYDRRTCRILHKGKDVGRQMVEAGWAWEAKKYSKGRYSGAMAKARRAKKGLWSKPDIQSPHCFRHPTFGDCKKDMQVQP